jgi:hypothetical protein
MISFYQARPTDFTIVKNDPSLKVFIQGFVVSGVQRCGVEGAEGKGSMLRGH